MSDNNQLGYHMDIELTSQPEMWERAIAQAKAENLLPADGARVAVVGCGTSWFMAQSYATAREAAGKGVTDAFAASEAFIATRDYDVLVAITRSGTTSEVLALLAELDGSIPTVAVIGDIDAPRSSPRSMPLSSCPTPTRNRWCRPASPPPRWPTCSPASAWT